MIDRKILEDALNKRYEEARQQLIDTKNKLPNEYKGFIDEHMKSLEKAYSDLEKSVNFYSLKNGNPENILKEFKFNCNSRLFNILSVATPERIMSYGVTFEQYKNHER